MPLSPTMTFADAATFQDSFDAVAAGTATPIQAQEVDAVVNAISQMMRPIGAAAGLIIDKRINLLASVPEDKQDEVIKALDGSDSAKPRLAVYRNPDGTALIGTPEEVAAYQPTE